MVDKKVLELKISNLESRLKMTRNETTKAMILNEIEGVRKEIASLSAQPEKVVVKEVIVEKKEEQPVSGIEEKFRTVESSEKDSGTDHNRGTVYSSSDGSSNENAENLVEDIEDNNQNNNNKKKKH